MRTTTRLVLTMGDPAGIGPEIIAKAARQLLPAVQSGELDLIVCGCGDALRQAEAQMGLTPDSAQYRLEDPGPVEAPWRTGEIGAAGGEWAYRAVVRAVERVLPDPAPSTLLSGFGASGLDLTVCFWIGDPANGQGNVRTAVSLALLALLRREGVDIPYPQQVVHQAPEPVAPPRA